jgi:hypothetical protein
LAKQALTNDFIGIAAGQGQAGVEAALNFGEVLALGLVGLANGGINVFLAGDDDPGAALALGAQLLGDGLQAEHELGIGADELPHLVHQENDLVVGGLGGEVVIDNLGKAFDVDAVVIAGAVKPLAGGIGRHFEGLGQGHHDVITQEVHRVTLFSQVLPLDWVNAA